jgi:D-alanyl-lipoteichoic acid acyltransferase DltB (MBOAT superfamily)
MLTAASDALLASFDQQVVLIRALIVATLLIVCLQVWGKPISMGVFAALAGIASIFVLGRTFPAFVLVNSAVFLVIRLLATSRRRGGATVICLVGLTLVFLLGRHYAWERELTRVGSWSLGLFYMDMWMFLRLFVLAWDVGAGKQDAPKALSFFAWSCNPLLLAGPLLRYSQWPVTMVPRPERLRDRGWWVSALSGLGMASVGLGVSAVDLMLRSRPEAPSFAQKVARVFFFGPWGFYLLGGGVAILIIALGRLQGVEVPPSFDRPFFQPNIAEFWARWNMTATSVFREYLFFNRWGLRSFNPYVNALVVFIAVGLWHASNLYWVLFGLLHGVYFCSYLWLRPRLRRFPGRVVRPAGVAVTYVCVCMAWYLPSKLLAVLRF